MCLAGRRKHRIMNRGKWCCSLLLSMLIGFSLPVYGEESSLEGQGNVKGLEEQIKNMNEDYVLLENEIKNALEECNSMSNTEELEESVQNLNRRSGILSKGRIQFENGEVCVTAADFIYLADEIDVLESTYKCSLVDSLNVIGTYFRNDGTVIHDSSQNEVHSGELKTRISFGAILQGILSSQAVESVKQIQATDKEGNLLYYANEEANNNKEKLNCTNTDTGFPVLYAEATADNISAGSAAWVNGTLLKGNGEDNKRSWQNGYNEGYTQGIADGLSKVNIQYTYHVHEGNSSAVGGCYGNCTGYSPVYCECWGWVGGSYGCDNCHHALGMHGSGYCTGIVSNNPYTYIGLVCGKTTDTIESATIIY